MPETKTETLINMLRAVTGTAVTAATMVLVMPYVGASAASIVLAALTAWALGMATITSISITE